MLLKLNQTVEKVLELLVSLLSPAQNVAVVQSRREPQDRSHGTILHQSVAHITYVKSFQTFSRHTASDNSHGVGLD